MTYVLISIGVFGTLTVQEVVGYRETAIAEAARPTLGDAGFTMMAVAALLATASSVNATLYASSGLTKMLAGVGQFPPILGRESRLGPHAGLLVTSGLVLLVANLVDLSAIASVGSACSLVIFLLVGVAAYKTRAETGAATVIVLAAVAVTATVPRWSQSTRSAMLPRRSSRSSLSRRSQSSSTSSGSIDAAPIPPPQPGRRLERQRVTTRRRARAPQTPRNCARVHSSWELLEAERSGDGDGSAPADPAAILHLGSLLLDAPFDPLTERETL